MLVYTYHHLVPFTDDQEGGRFDFAQCFPGQIGPAASGNHRSDALADFRGRHQRSRSACAGAEITDSQMFDLVFLSHPNGGLRQSRRQQADVETELPALEIHFLLFLREQVKQEGAETGFLKGAGHGLIAWTKTAAAAPMGEEYHGLGGRQDTQFATQRNWARRNTNVNPLGDDILAVHKVARFISNSIYIVGWIGKNSISEKR